MNMETPKNQDPSSIEGLSNDEIQQLMDRGQIKMEMVDGVPVLRRFTEEENAASKEKREREAAERRAEVTEPSPAEKLSEALDNSEKTYQSAQAQMQNLLENPGNFTMMGTPEENEARFEREQNAKAKFLRESYEKFASTSEAKKAMDMSGGNLEAAKKLIDETIDYWTDRLKDKTQERSQAQQFGNAEIYRKLDQEREQLIGYRETYEKSRRILEDLG